MSTYNIPVTRRRKALAAGLTIIDPIITGVEKVSRRVSVSYRTNLNLIQQEKALDALVAEIAECPTCQQDPSFRFYHSPHLYDKEMDQHQCCKTHADVYNDIRYPSPWDRA